MQNILVTGGAGYIGSHVVNILGQSDSYNLSIIDNLSTGRKKSVLYGELHEIDLEDLERVEKIFQQQKFEAVFHFAGSIIVPESVTNPEKYYFNNTLNSFHLAKLCLKYGVPSFIFSSTAAVYGQYSQSLCRENTPTNPINPYGRSKLMTEWMLEDFSHAHPDFHYVALRYFNVAGANIEGKLGQCSPQSTHLIKIICEVITGKRDQLQIYGNDYPTPDGYCVRDFIHIDDLAMAHLDALKYLQKAKQSLVANCGYGKGHSVKEILEAAEKVIGEKIPFQITSRRDGDAPSLIADSQVAKAVLNWKPKFENIELMIQTALDWEKKYSAEN